MHVPERKRVSLKASIMLMTLGLGVLFLCTTGCRQSEILETPVDDTLITIDYSMPFHDAGSPAGSLFLGEGWSPPSGSPDDSPNRPIIWALNAGSIIYFERPAMETEFDFYASGFPLSYADAPVQAVSVWNGSHRLGSAVLKPGIRQRIRIPLDAELLDAGFNTLQLLFNYAARPIDANLGQDKRRLSAAFEFLAIVPRSLEDPEEFLRSIRINGPDRSISLPIGGNFVVPLPRDSSVQLKFGNVVSRCSDCDIEVSLQTHSKLETVWRGAASKASHLEATMETPEEDASRVLVAVRNGEKDFGSVADVDIHIPVDFLTRARKSQVAREKVRPHVFIYLIDTVRADALSTYGYELPSSPHIDAFAREATVYQRAWAASAWTLPSVVSLLTGVYPSEHHITQGTLRLTSFHSPTLGALLTEAGYATLGASQSFIIGPSYGLDTGFTDFLLNNHLNSETLRTSDLRKFFEVWNHNRNDSSQPVFAYLHTVEPHAPYRPPSAFRHFSNLKPAALSPDKYAPGVFMSEGLGRSAENVERLRSLYDDEVLYADREFGNFIGMLKNLDLYENSLIILVSDHGEEFGEHGGFEHGRTVFEEMLRVPLIVKYPNGARAGERVEERVSLVDVMPTALSVTGVDASKMKFSGISLLDPDTNGSRRALLAELDVEPGRQGLGLIVQRAMVLDNVKCIESLNGRDQFNQPIPRFRAFDLLADPMEKSPLNAEDSTVSNCVTTMKRIMTGLNTTRKHEVSPVDGEQRARLRALGYVQ